VKRSAFLKHLARQGCDLLREGARHSWWWHPETGKRSAVPRHTEIADLLVRKICADLGVKRP